MDDRNANRSRLRYHDRSHLGDWPGQHAAAKQHSRSAGEARPAAGYGLEAGAKPRQTAREQQQTPAQAGQASRTAPVSRGSQRETLGWIIAIVCAVIAAFLIRAFLFEIILVDGESMMPTLLTDERIGIEKISRYLGLPQRGDIIIVKYPDMDGTYVKRTIGLPGETVEIRDSTVYIDGVPIAEDYVSDEPYADMESIVVPEDHVFVMGDNRAHSMDSRASYIGPISKDAILGHGLFVLWPFDNIHMIKNS